MQSANLPSILPHYTDDIEYHDPIVDIHGIEAMTGFLFRLFGSSPDQITTVQDETLIDGVYAATWTMVGQFNGVPYSAPGMSIVKFRDRSTQVYYARDYYTEGDIMANIPGLDEAGLGFRTYYRCAVDPTFDCPLEGTAALAGLEPAGIRTVSWFGRNDQGRSVASGTYFYQLTGPSFAMKKKMVLLK